MRNKRDRIWGSQDETKTTVWVMVSVLQAQALSVQFSFVFTDSVDD